MAEPFDVYSDSFAITVNPWGANLNLLLSESGPVALAGSQAIRVGTVRMSNEYLKTLAYMLVQRMTQHEADNDVEYNVPPGVLDQLGIAREDWDMFWRRNGE